jgi:hypothetical protein
MSKTGKTEISWKRKTEEGARRQVYAERIGDRWAFYVRQERFEQWQPMPNPPLEDWQELLDGVERRIARRLVRPEEAERVRKLISERFPDSTV